MNHLMAIDVFLNNKLTKTGINDKNINEARNEVKEIFEKKGMGNDTPMGKMIDSISDKLGNLDLSGGNLFQNMFSYSSKCS